ncbi:MAG: hypothetical protein ACREAK_01250 [Nitrosarchaeum sp.]
MKFGNSSLIIGVITFLIGIVLNDYLNSKQNVDFAIYVFSVGLTATGLIVMGITSVYKIISKKYNDS